MCLQCVGETIDDHSGFSLLSSMCLGLLGVNVEREKAQSPGIALWRLLFITAAHSACPQIRYQGEFFMDPSHLRSVVNASIFLFHNQYVIYFIVNTHFFPSFFLKIDFIYIYMIIDPL